MKKFFLVLSILFCFAVFYAYADSSITVTDAAGSTIVLSRPAKRIVSLNPTITEIIFAIGSGNNIVGVTNFCNYPEEANSIEKVGGFSGASISIEKIISLKPDIVFVSADMHVRIIELLNQAGIISFAYEPKNMNDIFSSITTLGQLTDCDDGAANIISQMQEKISQASKLSAGKKTVSVFWEIWNPPLMTAGQNTFINEAINLAGGKNIFDDVTSSWPEVSVEQVIMRNPQWIMSDDSHEENVTQAALMQRPGWARIDAVRNKKIGTIHADMIMRAGPRLADAILQMAEFFYGD
ncbi:MAG: cobalamin-binding protein [Treponema sp.]|nr:cobalamin-binding protein [Treponema sp.]